MKKILVIAFSALLLGSCTFVKITDRGIAEEIFSMESPDTAAVASETSEIGDFRKLVINVPAEVKFTQDALQSCDIRYEKPEDALKCRMSCVDGKFVISPVKKNVKFKGDVEVALSSAFLESIEINGACEFDADGLLKTEKFEIEINGAGEVSLDNLDCNFLTIRINGAGEIEAAGRADNTEVVINGVGKADLKGLRIASFSQKVNGLGTIER